MDTMTNKGRVLVVDDEPGVLSIVRSYLLKDGYQALEAQDGRKALDVFKREKPDLVVLDVMLPELDGIEVLREIRKTSQVPVIMLTARTEDADKLVGLELGADDYVSKPFSPRELMARIKAVLRRAQKPAGTEGAPICIGEMTVDPERFEVTCHGHAVALTATEFRIILALVQAAGRVLSRQQLLERAFDMAYEGYDRTVDAHIKNIRRKLSDASGGEGCNILTVQGVGYKLGEAACGEK
jgi:two-component system OmpR family response regulator